ncbi:NAD-dependent dehydratase [Clostridium sp. AL.422]|uniref:NAD-dependent dehydratase n=1 Tax=Clostridium TaxID=1485 RepID=UPI00293DFE34|nr:MULTISPECIES: NAD-dependent dehydratase [unclassified Clostridium]MDV4149471.1 NAD-dependent dehydratase [Clostridium sp. AL.422]
MKARIMVVGDNDGFSVELCKYLISRDLEVYLAVKKNQDLTKFHEIEKFITIIKYNDDLDEIKFILQSIEPNFIYTLYGLQHKTDIKNLIEKSYFKNILLLESLKTFKSIVLINLIERTERDEKGNPLNIYTAIVDSFSKVALFYKNIYKIETITTYKDEYRNII